MPGIEAAFGMPTRDKCHVLLNFAGIGNRTGLKKIPEPRLRRSQRDLFSRATSVLV